MAGKPAARLGDTTAHGGTIVVGAPTVLIGGMPAARVNDMHVCPMVNPGVPPPPHVGGPILMGSMTVMIAGQPAARVGDTCQCSGPPDSIVMGCMTVLIGDGGGGGGGGGSSSGGAGAVPQAAAKEAEEGHFLDVSFVDKAGLPVGGVEYSIKGPDGQTVDGTLAGNIRKGGVPEGNHEITLKGISKAEWSVKSARLGDKVKLKAETAGIPAGEKVIFDIYIKESRFAHKLLTSLESTLRSDAAEVEWELTIDEKLLRTQQDAAAAGGYSAPQYYFIVRAGTSARRSGVLEYQDWIEIQANDPDGKPLANVAYQVFLGNGEVRKGKLDGNGYAKIENLPPGLVRVKVDPRA